MSLSAAIATSVALDVTLIGFLAWMMSHPRHLSPHVPARDAMASSGNRPETVKLLSGDRRETVKLLPGEQLIAQREPQLVS